MSNPRILLVAALLATTGLAGCFSQPQADEPTIISRAHAIDLDAGSTQELGGADSPEEFLRSLVDTSLVVRVAEAGDYTLTFKGEDGRERTESLTGLQPGQPLTVTGADPFSAVTLQRGDAVVASRAPVPAGWWQVGDFPVGVSATSPSSAAYDLRSDARAEVSLTDVTSEDGQFHLDSLVATLAFPMKGDLSWALVKDGVEDRLDLDGAISVDDSRGSLLFFEMQGDMAGEPGTLGAELRSGNAAAEGALSMWLKDGRFVAGQFQGGSARAAPDLIAWATGAAAEEGGDFPCAGMAREDECSPEDIGSFDESQPASEREDFGDDAPRAEDAEAREALRVLEALLGADVGLHDELVVSFATSASDLGTSAEEADFDVRYVQEIKVVAKETIDVPAGSFSAYRIVQTVGFTADVERLGERQCAEWGSNGCESYETTTYVSGLTLDETLARTTIWLDATTHQPLKGSIEAPMDVGKVLREVVRSIDQDAWAQASLDGIDPEKIQLKTTTTASYEARSLSGDARFSPAVGFFLGSMMAGGFGGGMGAMGTMGMMPFARGYGYHDEVVPTPAYPMRSLSLSSQGPIVDGGKTYTVTSASPGTFWSDVGISVDGAYRSFAFDAECDGGMEYEFVACGPGGPKSYRDVVEAGDTLHLPSVESGQTLRVLDVRTNAVMMTLTIS